MKDDATTDLNLAVSPVAPEPSQPPRRTGSRLAGLAFGFISLVLLVAAYVNHQALWDWWQLRDYRPPAAVSRLADQDTMTDEARHLFYLNHPQLLDSVNTFRQRCPDSKDTVVLGCYHPPENGIFVYDVKDPKLQGVAQVTAAHETLHAAYGRLSAKDKASVDKLLNEYYDSGQASQRVKDEIALYQKTEPSAVIDEMHSTFGTEIANLPAPLEAYYKRYFINRSAIVAFQQQYQEEFDSRQAAIAQDDQRLSSLKQRIDAQEAGLNEQQKALQTERSRLNGLLAADNTAGYNAAASTYNQEVEAYNAGVASLKTAIAQYNQLVAARNEVAGELTTLDKALDTRLNAQGR